MFFSKLKKITLVGLFVFVLGGAWLVGAETVPPNPPPSGDTSPTGSLKIVKNTIGGGGRFTFSGNYGYPALTLETNAVNSFRDEVTMGDITAGNAYSITEAMPNVQGWALTSATCTNGGVRNGLTMNEVVIAAGQTTTCTFTNRFTPPPPAAAAGNLLTVKNTTGNLGNPLTTFQFNPVGFHLQNPLNQISVNTSSQSGTAQDLARNIPSNTTVSITEGLQPEWRLGTPLCRRQNGLVTGRFIDNRRGIGDIIIDPNQTTTCTFPNTVQPVNQTQSITITKRTTGNGSGGAFTFASSNNWFNNPNTLLLGPGNATSSRTIPNLPVGVYTISESFMPPNYSLTSASCSNGNNPTNAIVLKAGENITCTFTNAFAVAPPPPPPPPPPVGLTLSVQSLGAAGINITSNNNNTWGGRTNYDEPNIASGTLVSLTAPFNPPGFVFASWRSCDTVGGNFAVTCNITMTAAGGNRTVTANYQQTGSIIISKKTTGSGPGGRFVFDSNNNWFAPNDLTLAAGNRTQNRTIANRRAGTYTISESAMPNGYSLTSATCSNGDNPATGIVLGPGRTITCTFTNAYRATPPPPPPPPPAAKGTITITKRTLGGFGAFTFTTNFGAQNYTLTTNQNNGTTSQDVTVDVAKTYSVSEAIPDGWTLQVVCRKQDQSGTGNIGQNGVTNIEVVANQTTTCTFTNTKTAPPTTKGTLKIVKDTEGGDGTFKFTVTGPTPLSPSVTTSNLTGSTSQTVNPGTYKVTETVPSGFSYHSASCDSEGRAITNGVENIVVEAGKTATCTFKNIKLGSLKITKKIEGGSNKFTITTTGPDNYSNAKQVSANGSYTQSNLAPGDYNVSEGQLPAGWEITSDTCQSVRIEPGKLAECAVTNTYKPTTQQGTLMIIKNATGGNATFVYRVSGPTAWDFNINTAQGKSASKKVDPGTNFIITETLPSGWQATKASCGGSEVFSKGSDYSRLTNVKVTAGKTTVCTFYNITAASSKAPLVIAKNIPSGALGANEKPSFQYNVSLGSSNVWNATITYGSTPNNAVSKDLDIDKKYAITESLPKGWAINDIYCNYPGVVGQNNGTIVYDSDGRITGIKDVLLSESGFGNNNMVCTFTNTKAQPPKPPPTPSSSLKIIKKATGGDAEFAYRVLENFASTPQEATIKTQDGTGEKEFTEMNPGKEYNIQETIPDGWKLNALSCETIDEKGIKTPTGEKSGDGIDNVAIQEGKNTVCTFENSTDDGGGGGGGGDNDYEYEVNVPEPDLPFRFYR